MKPFYRSQSETQGEKEICLRFDVPQTVGYMRKQLDRLGVGADMTHLPWCSKTFKLPPSVLSPAVATSSG